MQSLAPSTQLHAVRPILKFPVKKGVGMEIDELIPSVEDIIPPLPGGQKYAAKVQSLFVKDKTGRKRIDHNFPETWGVTSNEAIEKLHALVDDWISKQ
jgi:hypothetical protein